MTNCCRLRCSSKERGRILAASLYMAHDPNDGHRAAVVRSGDESTNVQLACGCGACIVTAHLLRANARQAVAHRDVGDNVSDAQRGQPGSIPPALERAWLRRRT